MKTYGLVSELVAWQMFTGVFAALAGDAEAISATPLDITSMPRAARTVAARERVSFFPMMCAPDLLLVLNCPVHPRTGPHLRTTRTPRPLMEGPEGGSAPTAAAKGLVRKSGHIGTKTINARVRAV